MFVEFFYGPANDSPNSFFTAYITYHTLSHPFDVSYRTLLRDRTDYWYMPPR